MKRLQVVNFAKPSKGELYELDEAIKARNSKGNKAIHTVGTTGELAGLGLALAGKPSGAKLLIGSLIGKHAASHSIYGKHAGVIKDFKKKYGDKAYKDRKMLVLKGIKKK